MSGIGEGTADRDEAAASGSASARLAIAALFAGALCIAFSPIFARLLIDEGEVGPVASAFWRVGLAAPLLFAALAAVAWRRGRGGASTTAASSTPDARRVPWLLLAPGLFFAGDLAAWHTALVYTSVANATVLANFAAVIVAVIGYLFLRERFGGLFVAGTACALGGVVGLLLSEGAADSPFTADLRGDLLGLLAAAFYAGYLIAIKRVRATHGVLPVMAYSSLAAAVPLLALSVAFGEPLWIASARGWVYALAMAGLCHVLGQGLIAWALARLAASFSAVSLLVQPVAAAVWGWLILAQSLSATQVAAGLLVLLGIALARLGSADHAATPAPRVGSGTPG